MTEPGHNPQSRYHATCDGTLPVTGEIAQYLKEQGFVGFSPNSHLVAMPHLMPDVVDWISALIELGMPANHIHVLGKQYSQVDATCEKLRKLGVDVVEYTPAPIGGYYQTLQEVDLPKLWQHSLKEIAHAAHKAPQDVIVMDDGGRLLQSIPPELSANPNIRVMGVEQTTNGYEVVRDEGHKIDIVIPAKSALKLEYESPFVADAAIRKLRDKLGIFRRRDVAVVGIGNIGASVASTLADNHNNVFIYDTAVQETDGKIDDPKHLLPPQINIYRAPPPGRPVSEATLLRKGEPQTDANYYICSSLEQAVQSSNYVFGCTGRDIFKGIDLENMQFQGPGKKLDETRFISVSSGDKEFQSLLKWISEKPVFNHQGTQGKDATRWDVTANHNGSKLRVVQQGFPVNFDGKTCSGTPEEMQLISSFLLASIVQGYEYMKKYPVKSTNDQKDLIMLSPEVQRKILNTWLEGVPGVRGLFDPQRLEAVSKDTEWFAQHSLGQFCPVFHCDYPTPECLVQRVEAASHAEEKGRNPYGQAV